MTGFGVGTAALGHGSVAVEVRAVNGRFLDVRTRLPQELADLAVMVESEARKRLARGRCDVTVRTEGNVAATTSLDKEKARRAYRTLLELRDELAPGTEVPLSMLLGAGSVPRRRRARPRAARRAIEIALGRPSTTSSSRAARRGAAHLSADQRRASRRCGSSPGHRGARSGDGRKHGQKFPRPARPYPGPARGPD
jgi:uncharacterized protein YicC (UPF0701 family)